eukprot:12887215-Prorocentrum_lima.AAC.1
MWTRSRPPMPAQTSIAHFRATLGVGSELIVNRMTQPKAAYPKHVHSKHEPPLQPPSSASAAS